MSKETGGQEKFWYVMGDIHDKPENLEKLPDLNACAGLIISGDLTNYGNAAVASKILEHFMATGKPVLAQLGNMDFLEVNDMLNEKQVNLHGQVRELGPDIAVFGIGGSTPTPMNTPTEFSEAQYGEWLAQEWQKAEPYAHKILVSHNPPKNTICDDIGGGVHVGSSAVRDFIEKHHPEICVCGHIHEGKGAARIGNTIVINPGQFAEGGYVKLSLKDGKLDAVLLEIA